MFQKWSKMPKIRMPKLLTLYRTPQNLYPTFLRTSPPHSDDAQVLTRVLIKLHYRQVVVVVVEGDENGEQFVARMEHQGARHKIQVFGVRGGEN